MIETYRGAIYPWHCDHMGHMNVMWYVGKFDEATWTLFATIGITAAFLKASSRGMAAVQQNITYKRALHAGETVIVRSTFLEVREKLARFSQTRKSCPFPAEIVERGRSLVGVYDLPT